MRATRRYGRKPAVQRGGLTARGMAIGIGVGLLAAGSPGCVPHPKVTTVAGEEAGQRLYVTYCAQCHGSDGRNDRQGANPQMRLRSADRLPEVQWRAVVLQGRNAMPAFAGRLHPSEVDVIHRYVGALTLSEEREARGR